MNGLRGFGFRFDIATGAVRRWYMGADGVQRWADNDQPVDAKDGAA
jgi:hypothetical protein